MRPRVKNYQLLRRMGSAFPLSQASMQLFVADRAALSGGLSLNSRCVERVIAPGARQVCIGTATGTRFRKLYWEPRLSRI